jgi:uncharacterized membrane protein
VKTQLQQWQANFLTGLAVVLPAVLTLAIVRFVFGTIASLTDVLLFFLPQAITHERGGEGAMHWYWSVAAIALAVVLVSLVGRATRYYIGRRIIAVLDSWLSQVPLLNKIYGTIKQVNEAFSSTKKSAFKQVVLIEYPRAGVYSVAFVTSDENPEATAKTGHRTVGVYVPTTPNPTSGFLLVVPIEQIIPLEMSVADGIKYVISLGSVIPDYPARLGTGEPAPPAA